MLLNFPVVQDKNTADATAAAVCCGKCAVPEVIILRGGKPKSPLFPALNRPYVVCCLLRLRLGLSGNNSKWKTGVKYVWAFPIIYVIIAVLFPLGSHLPEKLVFFVSLLLVDSTPFQTGALESPFSNPFLAFYCFSLPQRTLDMS